MKQTDEHGAEYEPMEGERETGDGDGDKKYSIDSGVLSLEEIAELTQQD